MHPVTQMIRCYLEPVRKPKSDKGKGRNNEPREDASVIGSVSKKIRNCE
jgi:hypothetical protein